MKLSLPVNFQLQASLPALPRDLSLFVGPHYSLSCAEVPGQVFLPPVDHVLPADRDWPRSMSLLTLIHSLALVGANLLPVELNVTQLLNFIIKVTQTKPGL